MGGDDDVLDYSVDPFEGMGPNFIFRTLGQCLVGDKSDMPYYLDTNLYLDKKIVLDLSRSIHSTIFLRDLKFFLWKKKWDFLVSIHSHFFFNSRSLMGTKVHNYMNRV